MTLRADGDAELLQAQRAFHLAAGVDAVVDPGDISSTDADWVLPAAPGEFWWPRGGSLREVLSAIPAEYAVVQALVRPFVTSETADALDEGLTHRLFAQAMLDDPAGSPRPSRRLAYRVGVDLSAYEGEIPKALTTHSAPKSVAASRAIRVTHLADGTTRSHPSRRRERRRWPRQPQGVREQARPAPRLGAVRGAALPRSHH
jgi:hypothetical protein